MVALAFDAADDSFGVWTTGSVDEVAHLCTAALGCSSWRSSSPHRFYVAALIASVVIDLDHVPLYLGLPGNQAQRPVTHSLSTVAGFVVAAVASRRHRAVLARVTAGLVLHLARDIAEGYPGVRVFWPLQDTSWMVSYRWFWGMIIVFTATRLVLVGVGLPNTRIPVFRAHHRLVGSRADVMSYRWRGCGRQADLVLPDQVEHVLSIVWVDREDAGCPPSGCLRERRGFTELWHSVRSR